jgi:hypothetical protein
MSGRWDEDWRKVKYLDWLVIPPTHRDPRTRQELATLLHVQTRTLRMWSEEPEFRDEWRRRVSKLIGSPERAQRVMDTLYEAASDITNRNQVQAAKLYLEATNAIKPGVMEVTVKRPTELSDEELDALLAQGAKELREDASATDG